MALLACGLTTGSVPVEVTPEYGWVGQRRYLYCLPQLDRAGRFSATLLPVERVLHDAFDEDADLRSSLAALVCHDPVTLRA
jgi:hypothetical protein